MRYCLEVISQTKTDSLHSTNDPFSDDFIPERKFMFPYIFKSHTVEAIKEAGYDVKQDILILLLRNYKECILRNFYNDTGELKMYDTVDLDAEIKHYIKNIIAFNFWEGEKLLIYYEDLMTDFEGTFQDVVNVLALPECRFREFVSKLSYHRERSVVQYKPGSHTKGMNLLHHSKKLSLAGRMYWDRKVESVRPWVDCYLEPETIKEGMFDG